MLEAKDTSASALQKKKKKSSGDLQKKGLHKNFSSDLHERTFSKKFFNRSTKFLQFKKYCCPRAEDRPIFEDLRPRGQGQGLQNVSSRPRTSSRTPPLVETDANAPHAIWGSSDINPGGEDLLAYCVSADLNFCNVGNNPTFRTKTREEVQDLT